MTRPHSQPTEPERRDVSPREVAALLRAALGLDPLEQLPDERAADHRRPFPAVVQDVWAGAWIGWCLIGLAVFSGSRFPPLGLALATTKRLMAALSMIRSRGNLSKASAMLDTSRKRLRDLLRDAACYPWRSPGDPLEFDDAVTEEIPTLAVVEDPGVVVFRVRNRREGVGPAWLVRGDQRERLFHGHWADRVTARTYARARGHRFEVEGEDEAS